MTGNTGARITRLRLDPDLARCYGLPAEFPFELPAGFDPERTPAVDLHFLARGLSEVHEGLAPRLPELRRFAANWPLIESMERYLSMGNFTFAERTARELDRQDPGLPCAAFARGVAASRAGDTETAADLLESVLSACPRHVPAMEELVTVLALAGSWDGALLLLDRLDDTSPESGGSGLYRTPVLERSAENVAGIRDAMTRVSTESRKDDRDALLLAVESASRLASDNAEVHRRAALTLRAAGDRVRARTLAEKAARLDPRSAAAHHTLARLAIESGDLIEAERAAVRARSLAPGWRDTVTVLASTLRADGRPAHAARMLKQAGEEHPEDMTLRKLEALCLLEAGRPAEARDTLLSIARHDDFDPAAHFNLARAHEALRDWTAAREAYAKAIERAPGFAAARESLALLDFRQGRVTEARNALESLVREEPDQPHGYRGLGDLVLDLDPGAAGRWYEAALARNPDFVCGGLFYLAGLKALLDRNYPEAARLFDASVKADARRHRAWCNLGVARFHEGRIEPAIAAMEEAVSLEPGVRGYHENLAAFYWAAFRRHPFRNFRFLSRSRRARAKSRELSIVTG